MNNSIQIGARLRASRKAAGFKTSREFIKKFNIPASTYSQHESGARTPDEESLKLYCATFEVNFKWVKTGKGKPYTQSKSNKKNSLNSDFINFKKPANYTIINQMILAGIIEKTLSFKLNVSKIIAKEIADAYMKATEVKL